MIVYTAKGIARALGVPESEIRALTAAGMIEAKDGLYELEATARQLIRERSSPEQERQAVDYRTERAKLARVKRLNAEYDLKIREGQLHHSEDIETAVSAILMAFKSRIQTIPTRAAATVTGMTDRTEVFEVIKKLTDEALAELSDFDKVMTEETDK